MLPLCLSSVQKVLIYILLAAEMQNEAKLSGPRLNLSLRYRPLIYYLSARLKFKFVKTNGFKLKISLQSHKNKQRSTSEKVNY